MDEFDSLNSSEGSPVEQFSRPVDLQATARLLQGLSQNGHLLDQQYGPSVLDLEDGQTVPGLEISQNRQIELFPPEYTNQPGVVGYPQTGEKFEGSEQGNREMLGEEKLFNPHINFYRRGPEGSPSFQQSSGFLPSAAASDVTDNESVVFRPRGQLDFSALDETGQTDIIIPHGMNRSVSTPERRGNAPLMERHVCGSHDNDRNSRGNSPNTHFYELKNSPLLSEDEELDSQVIFSPLQAAQNTSMAFQPHLSSEDFNTKDNKNSISEQREESEGSASPILSPRKPVPRYQTSPFNGQQTSHQRLDSPVQQFDERSSSYTPTEHTFPDQMSSDGRTDSQPGEKREVFVSIPHVNRDVIYQEVLPQNTPEGHQHSRSSGMSPGYNNSPQSSRMTEKASMKLTPEKNAQIHGSLSLGFSDDRDHLNGSNDSNVNSPSNQRGSANSSISKISKSPDVIVHSPTSAVNNRQRSPSNNQPKGGGLPSPSIWEIPEPTNKSTKKTVSNNSGNVFKEPKVPDVKRHQPPQNKRPNMPAKNSQRDILNPQRSRPEQVKRDSQAPQSKVKGQDTRSAMYSSQPGSKSAQANALQQGQKIRNIPDSRSARNNAACDRYGRMVQGNYSEYERKVEGGAGMGKTPRQYGDQMDSRPRRETTKNRGVGIGQDLSPHAQNPGVNVVTQVEHYGPGSSRDTHRVQTQQNSHSDWSRPADSSVDVQGMEEVRGQLKNMLKLSSDIATDDHYNYNDHVSGLLLDMPTDPYLYQPLNDHPSVRNPDDMSELAENFPSFSRMWSESSNVSRSEASIHAENQRLRDILEKERYRRKHCEQHIQKLNVKLLETQQQVAVAVSTDKRKDIMIEQLDKQLAKVVEGWKKRDEEKEDYISKIMTEKNKVEENLSKQRKIIENFESDMAQAVEEIRKEKEKALLTIEKLQTEADERERSKAHLEEQLQGEKEKNDLMNKEWDTVRETRELGERKIQQLQDRLHKEQDEWFKREQELLQRIEEVTQNNMKMVQDERRKCEEQESLLKEIEDKIQANETEMKRQEMELDAVHREKESLKVEMGIMEAKFESSQRALEAEMHSNMQKEIAAQMAEVHKKFEEEEEKTREGHRKVIKEISQRHTKETEKQLSRFHDDLKKHEDEHRKICQEYEEKLHESRSEITNLQSVKQKLESQRSEILVKLQYMMQSQWNEAVNLLTATPQRKSMTTSFTAQPSLDLNSSVLSLPPGLPSSHNNQEDPSAKESATVKEYSSLPPMRSPPRESRVTSSTPPRSNVLSHKHIMSESPGQNIEANGLPHGSQQDTGGTVQGLGLEDFTTLRMQEFLQSLSHPITNQVLQNIPSTVNQPQQPPVQSVQTSHMDREEVGQLIELTNHGVHQMSFNRENSAHINSKGQSSYSQENSVHANSIGQRSEVYDQSVQKWLQESSVLSQPDPRYYVNSDSSVHNQKVEPTPVPVAVAIRPPQQHSSGRGDYSYHTLNNSGHSQKSGGSDTMNSWNTHQVVHSPPTKQVRSRLEEARHPVEELDDSSRLTAEYRDISDKIKEHESRQGHLQHYIQMLLQKAPGGSEEGGFMDNDSQLSQDQTEELDLNDTAQAAQLQEELTRIQQLREKQGTSYQHGIPKHQEENNQQGANISGILNPEQLAQISRYLGQQNQQQQDSDQITDLIGVLKNFQERQPQESKPQNTQTAAASPGNRDVARVKRNLKTQMSGLSDGNQGADKHSGSRSQHPKKIDRKVAQGGGPAAGAKPNQGKSKSAWK